MIVLVEGEGWRTAGGAHIRVGLDHLPIDCTVSLTGDNGVGKSVLLTLIGWTEQGDDLVGKGGHRGLMVSDEAQFVVWRRLPDGRLLKVRRRQGKRSHEVFIDVFQPGPFIERDGWMEVDGQPETLCSGLVSTAPAILAGLGVLPANLYRAAYAASQSGEGSFFSLSKVDDRRALIGAAADLQRYDAHAQRGEAWRPTLKKVADALALQVDILRGKGVDLATLDGEIQRAAETTATAQAAEATAAAAVEHAATTERAAATTATETRTAAAGLRASLDQLRAALSTAQDEADALTATQHAEPLPDMRARLAAARAARDRQVAAKGAYDAACARVTETERAEQAARQAVTRAGTAPNRAALEAAIQEHSEAAAQVDQLAALEEAARLTADEAARAAAALAGAPTTAARAEAAVQAAAAKVERLTRVGGFVRQVPCQGEKLWSLDTQGRSHRDVEIDCSTCPALADAQAALAEVEPATAEHAAARDGLAAALTVKRQSEEAAARATAAQVALRDAAARTAAARAAREKVATAQRDLERCDVIDQAIATLRQAEAALADARAEKARLIEEGRQIRADLAAALLCAEADARPSAIDELATAVESRATAAVDGGAAQAARLHERVAELKQQIAQAEVAVAAAGEREAAAQAAASLAASQLATARAQHATARDALQEARSQAERLAGRREPLAREMDGLAALEAALEHAREELADYEMLEVGFGPRGVPGLIIDAESGRLVEDVQQILDVVWGDARPDVDFRTFDGDAARSKQEQADLVVRFPGETEWRNATDVSGGQAKLLDQAFRGALRRMIARRTGKSLAEILHDERDTGLDLARQREYVPMIRATGPGRHIIVSHNEQVRAACDVRLYLDADGGVRWE